MPIEGLRTVGGEAPIPGEIPTTRDAFLGGRLMLRQPADGYRAAIDPVLLAASVTAPAVARIVDLGCGIGTAGLCLLTRLPALTCVGVDIQAPLIDLATANAAENGLADRYQARCGSILDRAVLTGLAYVKQMGVGQLSADQVIVNPPYLPQGEASLSAHPIKALANVESDAALADWVAAAATILRPGGLATFIHRADRLPEVLAYLRDQFGALRILPIQSKAGDPAKRVIVRGQKGSRAPAKLLAPFVMHGESGGFTPAADAILRDGGALPM